MSIEWKAMYEVGIKPIDNQHKYLVSLINRLEDSSGLANESTEIHDIFFELVNYTKYHFQEEEKFLESFEYENLHVHKAQHKVLIKQIVEMLNTLKRGELEIGEKLTSILENWIIKHVLHHDKMYAKKYFERKTNNN